MNNENDQGNLGLRLESRTFMERTITSSRDNHKVLSSTCQKLSKNQSCSCELHDEQHQMTLNSFTEHTEEKRSRRSSNRRSFNLFRNSKRVSLCEDRTEENQSRRESNRRSFNLFTKSKNLTSATELYSDEENSRHKSKRRSFNISKSSRRVHSSLERSEENQPRRKSNRRSINIFTKFRSNVPSENEKISKHEIEKVFLNRSAVIEPDDTAFHPMRKTRISRIRRISDKLRRITKEDLASEDFKTATTTETPEKLKATPSLGQMYDRFSSVALRHRHKKLRKRLSCNESCPDFFL